MYKLNNNINLFKKLLELNKFSNNRLFTTNSIKNSIDNNNTNIKLEVNNFIKINSDKLKENNNSIDNNDDDNNNNDDDEEDYFNNKLKILKKKLSYEEQKNLYEKFLKIDRLSEIKDFREIIKLPEYKELPYSYQMKYLSDTEFPESSKSQIENFKIRMRKQWKKDLQRERSFSQINRQKDKSSTPLERHLKESLLNFEEEKYESVIQQFIYSKIRLSDECGKIATESFLRLYADVSLTDVRFPRFLFEGLLKRLAFLKYPIADVTEFLSKMGYFKVPMFYDMVIDTNESYLYVYLYDIGKHLKENSNQFNSDLKQFQLAVYDGSGFQAKLLHSLITSHRREEAIKEFEQCSIRASDQFTGEYIYYFIQGLIKMGYIEKSKLIMSQYYSKLSKDPFYILASINMSLAIGKVELAINLIINSNEHLLSMMPVELLQMVILETGRVSSKNLDKDKKQKYFKVFKRILSNYLDDLDSNKLLFNCFNSDQEIQLELLKDIQKYKYKHALSRFFTNTFKGNLEVLKDQDGKDIPVTHTFTNVEYKDDSLPENFEKDLLKHQNYRYDISSLNFNQILNKQVDYNKNINNSSFRTKY